MARYPKLLKDGMDHWLLRMPYVWQLAVCFCRTMPRGCNDRYWLAREIKKYRSKSDATA